MFKEKTSIINIFRSVLKLEKIIVRENVSNVPVRILFVLQNILRGFECAQIVHFPNTTHRDIIFHRS